MTSMNRIASVLLLQVCTGIANAAFLLYPTTHISLFRKPTSMQSHKSVNHGTGDYYFQQEPKGRSFISQVSKRDLEERRQPQMGRAIRPPEWSQVPYFQHQQQQPHQPQPPPQQQSATSQQPVAATPTASQTQAQYNIKEIDSISANIKAMTSLLGDVKESLTAQTSDIRWLNQKYQEIEKRLERAEIFNTAISQEVSEMKLTKKSSSEPKYEPLNGENESDKWRVRDTAYTERDKDRFHEKLDKIKEQMSQLDFAIKVGEVTLNSHMEDVNRRFDSMKSPSTVDSKQNNINHDQQTQQPLPEEQYHQPQPNNLNQQFNQPQPNNEYQHYRQPQPPPFEPSQNYPAEPVQHYPANFQEPPFQMGSFRYEGYRPGVSYEIPSPRQTQQSQSSANYNTQRRNKSFISSISEQELSQRRELFEPVPPMRPFDSAPMALDYYDYECDDFYPEEPFFDGIGYFDQDLY